MKLEGYQHFGQSSGSDAPNNSIFLDSSDNILKIKDNSGVIQSVGLPDGIVSGSDQISGSFVNIDGDTMTGGLTTPNVSSSYIDLSPLTNGGIPSYNEGRLFYNTDDGALSLYNDAADITLQIGQEFYIKVINKSGVDIFDGTPVFISGSLGDRPIAHPAVSDIIDITHNQNHIIGVATHDILIDEVGYVTTQGLVHGIDTSDFASGDILYLSSSVGQYTNILPEFPYEKIQVATVMRSHANGIIYVRPVEPIHMSDISGLSGSNGADGDVWVYDGSNGAWYPTQTGLNLTGSFSGSFFGDGSNLTGVGSDLPSGVISGSSQLDGTTIDSLELTNTSASGSFSGSFFGDGSNLSGISAGDVSKVGTPVNNEIPFWTGDGTLASNSYLTRSTGTNIEILNVGSSDLIAGGQRLYGRGDTVGGFLAFYNGGLGDANDDYYEAKASAGVFKFTGVSTGDFLNYTSATQILDLPKTIQLSSYGGGLNVGTPTQALHVDVSGNVIEVSGSVIKSGTTGNRQVASWNSDGTIRSNTGVEIGADQKSLYIGNDDSLYGNLVIWGGIGSQGGSMSIYNATSYDSVDQAYTYIAHTGQLRMYGSSTGNFITYTTSTRTLDLPKHTTLADASGSFTGSLNSNVVAPTSVSGSGTQGEIRTDADYIYVCTATDTWKRSPLSSW